MPAAAVIQLNSILKLFAVKRLASSNLGLGNHWSNFVVYCLLQVFASILILGGLLHLLIRIFTLKIRVFRAGVLLEYNVWNNRIGRWFYFTFELSRTKIM